MEDSDFDLLCEGASPEEAKRLRKVLAEWFAGDESGFPLQFVLITRAQWRAAARVTLSVNEALARLLAAMDDREKRFQTSFDDFDQVTASRLDGLKKLETEDVQKRKEAIAVIEAQMLKVQAVAVVIQTDLAQAKAAWTQAKDEFEAERNKLESAEKQMEARLNLRDWIVFALLLVMAAIIGGGCVFIFGSHPVR